MKYRNAMDAEIALYGDHTYALSVRSNPGSGEDYLDDMAQAWIEGRHDEVNAYVARRLERIRSMQKPAPCATRGRPRFLDRDKIRELRARGWKLRDIARLCKCGVSQVSIICRSGK